MTPQPPAGTPMIEVAGLVVAFGDGPRTVTAVDSIDFRVARGEAFGLVGESGSGKSTVLRVLAGLTGTGRGPRIDGAVTLAGTPLPDRPGKAFYRRVQMVFQDPYGALHPRQTVDRILSEPLAIHGIGDVDRRIAQALSDVGLGPAFRFRYPHQLSGGQRQRVAIARALMLEPEILLLDEPTSALDVSVQAEVLNLLADLRRDRGLTYVLVSHDLAVIGHMCDRLAVMLRGKIVETLDANALSTGVPTHPYTRRLRAGADGYDPRVLDDSIDL